MASRMDRYRNQELETTGMRTKRNEHLYARVEAPLEYSSVEGVARIDNTNSVDINKIKELLLREEEPKKKHHSKMEKQETLEDTSELVTFNQLEDKNYDIRDILNKAKDEKEEDDADKYRNLQNTGYDILKNIQVQKKPTEISDQELNHVGDTTLSLSMLDNLQDNEEEEITETMSSKTIRDLLNEETSKEEPKYSLKIFTKDQETKVVVKDISTNKFKVADEGIYYHIEDTPWFKNEFTAEELTDLDLGQLLGED